MSYQAQIIRAADLFRNANEVFVVTGAGISADSGLPTYRGIGGLYEDVETEDGVPIEVALSGPMFQRRPELTWKYLAQIEAGARDATQNRAHEILAEMERKYERFWILTQNIDGFHHSSGSTNVIEIHGNMHRMRCTQCRYQKIYADYTGFEIPPFCPDCRSRVRPDVVLFEEQLPENAISTLYRELGRPFDLVVSIGTSSYFPYIIEPVVQASRNAIPTIEINPADTPISEVVDVKLKLGAKDSLEAIWKELKN